MTEKHTYNYNLLNTSTHLLQACDELAIRIRHSATTIEEADHCDFNIGLPYKKLNRDPRFIGLNLIFINSLAAVLEGTFKTIICEIMQENIEHLGENLSKIKHSSPEYKPLARSFVLYKKYSEEVEFRGGWENLKRQYKEILNLKIDGILSKKNSAGINSIFTLRNVSAHGTAIITPTEKLSDISEGEYTFKWQSRLQSLTDHLEGEFNLGLMDALQHPSLSLHFTELVKELIVALNANNKLAKNSLCLIKNLENYSFGYQNNFHSPV